MLAATAFVVSPYRLPLLRPTPRYLTTYYFTTLYLTTRLNIPSTTLIRRGLYYLALIKIVYGLFLSLP